MSDLSAAQERAVMSGAARGKDSNPSEAPQQTPGSGTPTRRPLATPTRAGTGNTNDQPATDDLSPAQERAVRLALTAAHYRHRAQTAEATLARIQALHDYWANWNKPEAHELHQALTSQPTDDGK